MEFVCNSASALEGGTDLSGIHDRVGIYRISTYDGNSAGGSCTATLLYSSQAESRSWLVTAAHCFSHKDDLFYVYDHFSTPHAAVRYDTSPGSWTSSEDSTVHVHPEWLANGGHTAWFGPRDMAFIRVDAAIPVLDADGNAIPEYRRPIYTGSPYNIAEPFESQYTEEYAPSVK